MRIVVTSNCMTGGLTAGLRILLPEAQIIPIPRAGVDLDVLNHNLSTSNVWVLSHQELTSNVEVKKPDDLKVILFPELAFRAFHPDQVYASLPDGTLIQTPTGPYNSAIALWAWQHNLNVSQTIDLFTPSVFDALEYHNSWHVPFEHLRSLFKQFPLLDFQSFILPLVRSGAFMHTVNHPKVSAIAQMARLLANQIDPSADYFNIPIEHMMVDTLFMANYSWSVYPSVANSLGIDGAFMWKLLDHSVIGLEEFISRSFEMYDAQQPVIIDCPQLARPIYDDVLLPLIQVKAL